MADIAYGELSLRKLLKLSKKGDVTAAYYAAKVFLHEDDYPKAIEQLEIAISKSGDFTGKACVEYGLLLFKGDYVAQDYERAFKMFFNAAVYHQSPAGAYYVGYCYENGLGVKQSKAEARSSYEIAAERGYQAAIDWLDQEDYLYGKKTDEEYRKMSLQQLKDRYEVDDPLAAYFLGMRYYDEGNFEAAYELFSDGYKKDAKNFYCLTGLGLMYQKGEHVKQDDDKALDCYLKAANGGNQIAINNAALMYEARKDFVEALKWFEKLAKLDDVNGYLKVGEYLEKGLGVDVSVYKAIDFYEKAASKKAKIDSEVYNLAKKGDPESLLCLAHICLEKDDYYSRNDYLNRAANSNYAKAQEEYGIALFKGEVFTNDKKLAAYYLTFASKANLPEATYYLAMCYEQGKGVNKSLTEAFKLYDKAASLGYEPAKERAQSLGELVAPKTKEEYLAMDIETLIKRCKADDPEAYYHLGNRYYDNKEYEKAFKVYQEGYKKDPNNIKCLNCLGVMYYYGRYVEKDIFKYFDYIKEAADKGYAGAMCNLGIAFYRGDGVGVDLEEAYKWFSKAAKGGEEKAHYYLSLFYRYGLYVDIDIDKAIAHYKASGDLKKDPNSPFFKELEALKLVDKEILNIEFIIDEAIKTSKKLPIAELEKRYSEGDYSVCGVLGNLYYLNKQFDKAYQVYTKGFDTNFDSTCANGLGLLYYYGLGVESSRDHARSWFERATKAIYPDPNALYNDACMKGTKGDSLVIKSFKNAAAHGSKAAIKELAKKGITLYLPGINEELNYQKLSTEQLEKLYKNKDYGACDELGYRYYKDKQYKKSFEIFKEALAFDRSYYAAFYLGKLYYEGKVGPVDYEKAKHYFTMSALQNFSYAQYMLGVLYEKGKGTKVDKALAAELYQKATDSGLSDAQYNLGCLYRDGEGVKMDKELAVKYFTLAAKQNHTLAQKSLASCYEAGEGVKTDQAESFRLLKLAADKGDADAQNQVGFCYERGEGVKADLNEAFKYYKMSADQGYVAAINNLGVCYYYGLGVRKNRGEAFKCFKKAAKEGNAIAICNLGDCYRDGDGTQQNYYEAMRLYKQAAELGNAKAMSRVGYFYDNALSVIRSRREAAIWYRKSAEGGYAYGQFALGFCYERGQGLAADMNEAIKWYKKAAAQGEVNAIKRLKELGYKI